MSPQNWLALIRPLRAAGGFSLLGLATWLIVACASAGDSRAAADESRAMVGKAAPLSALLHREGTEKSWRIIKPGSAIYDGDLIVAVPGGSLTSKNGAVRLSLLSDLARLSPYPVLESAVVVHENPDFDLDFTLDRGRVDVINQQKGMPARVQVRFRDQKWQLTLTGDRARVALELYGRWPRGVPFIKNPKEAKQEEEPTADLVLLTLAGSVELKTPRSQQVLHAPPGPAYFHWDSAGGEDPAPTRQEELPAWARPNLSAVPRIRDLTAVLKTIQQRLLEGTTSIEEGLVETLSSENSNARRIAVYALGALDDLPHLIDALSDPKHGDVREVAVSTLRHWIGRDKGQDLKLYEVLIKERMFSANQAEIVLQLLHSYGSADLRKPAVFETLIDYLLHDKLAIRALAKWHLDRLVPGGKEIAYDPAGEEGARQKAYDAWKKLVPSGQLPPEPKSAEPKTGGK